MFEWIERYRIIPLHCEPIEQLNYHHPKQEKLMLYRNCKLIECSIQFVELMERGFELVRMMQRQQKNRSFRQ